MPRLIGHRLQEALSAPLARNAKHVRSGGEPAMDYEPITAPILPPTASNPTYRQR